MFNTAVKWWRKTFLECSSPPLGQQQSSELSSLDNHELFLTSENPSAEKTNHPPPVVREQTRRKWNSKLITIVIVVVSGLSFIIMTVFIYKYRKKKNGLDELISFRKKPSQYFNEWMALLPQSSSLSTRNQNSMNLNSSSQQVIDSKWRSSTEPYLNDTASYYQYMLRAASSSRDDTLKFHPQWKFSPSYTDEVLTTKKKKNSSTLPGYGFVQYRTQSLFGREAGLPRVFSSSANGEDLSLLNASFHDEFTQTPYNWMYYLEKIRYIISLLYYRLPRAIAEWELWLGMASLGLYHVWMNQPFSKWRNATKEQEKTQQEAKHFMDGVMHRVISESSVEKNSRSPPKVVKVIGEGSSIEGLEENFEKLLSNEQADSYL
nr:unnamed protein product [Naegleria fowleri]